MTPSEATPETAPDDTTAEAWPPEAPRVVIPTCMKNEGPFILEWIAWHRAIGVTDFIVYTNHCTDGSDALLDRLDEMGIVTHLENPAIAQGSTYYQPAALKHAQTLPVFQDADFAISMDVDEFVNIRAGDGRLSDLFAASGPFDVLSMHELNHGANRRERFESGWVKDLFPGHQSERPGRWKAARGVKSITRLGPRIATIRNHRPDLAVPAHEVIWLDGSGNPLADLAADPSQNGADCRGRYELVALDHFALRSLEDYLMKAVRGDVVVAGKRVSERYWRIRNLSGHKTSTFERADARARAEYRRLIADRELARLHEACCEGYAAQIAEALQRPEMQARRDWVLRESW